jgi:hypothetical protein
VVKNLNYYVVQVAGGGEGGAEGGVLIMPALCGEKFELLCGAGCGWRGKVARVGDCKSCLPSVVKNLNYSTVWCRLRVEGKVVQRAECCPIQTKTYENIKRQAITMAGEPVGTFVIIIFF